MKIKLLAIIFGFSVFLQCGLFQANNDSAKNGLMAVLGLSAFMGTGAGGDVPVGASYIAWGSTSCATGWTTAYVGYMQMPYIRSATPTVGVSNLICSASTISGLTALQTSFYSRPSGFNYGAQGEAYMSQFADNVQNCAVCVK
ncbi:hypothetical protein JWG41_03920 [Leptospira sp. 201903075]|uniref:hypothetical protein n=1 Tax=Leptospira chreensis TaxID=2810035 RepID=UPI001966BA4D|nr:hypothetical protein [Leptospira chreensis]MBM9589577.1 hypothetical protein [Leptospira chreensis]